MIRCACHDESFDRDERIWLKEDGSMLCDDGHRDEQHEDPFDREDHGTPYDAGMLLAIFNQEWNTTSP